MDRIDKQIDLLMAAAQPAPACGAIDTLRKIAAKASPEDRRRVLAGLMDFVCRSEVWPVSHAAGVLVELIQEGETDYAPFFRSCIQDGQEGKRYWGIEGYAKTAGKDVYLYFTDCLTFPGFTLEHKALMVRNLARLSGQPFDLNRPIEPRAWRECDIDCDAILQWRADGCPDGAGYPAPVCHPCLLAPQTALEKLYARLEKKLLKKRSAGQDPAHPSNWLIQADPADLARITEQWSLPPDYLDFLEKASPLSADLKIKGYGPVEVYGAHNLADGQAGYSRNGLTGEPIADWPASYLVIASRFGDPFCLDLAQEQSPVWFAFHGEGAWDFSLEFPSLTDFLKALG